MTRSYWRATGLFVVTVAAGVACGGKKKSSSAAAGGESGAKSIEAPVPIAASRGPEHALFSLTDNRLLAHVLHQGGLVIDATSPGLAKYQHLAKPRNWWKNRVKVEGKSAVKIDNYAPLEFPLDEAGAAATEVRLYVFGAAADQPLTVSVNGQSSTQKLAAGWQTLKYAAPAGALKNGENKLQFVYGKGEPPAVSWVQIGGEPLADGPVAPLYDAGAKALSLPKGRTISYFIQAPKEGLIAGDVPVTGCTLDVSFRPADGAPVTGQLVGNGSAVAFGAAAGKLGRLDIRNASCDAAKLVSGALVVPGAAKDPVRPSKPKNVVLWINDSLRGDRIKAINPTTRVESPMYDKLAESSTWFTSAYVQGNESRASHASIWTSVYPVNHRMAITPGSKVAPEWVTIDEAMKAAGLLTSAVTANGYITEKWGYGSTWDLYHNNIHSGGGVRGADVLKLGVESIKDPKKPFFLYLGLIDNHVSWRAKEPWMAKYDPEPYSGPYVTELAGITAEKISGKIEVPERDKKRVIAIYDSNVSYADDLMKQFFEQLKAWSIDNETMLVMTADHGDELWEDGKRIGHGASLRESLVHVPLLIHYPPLFPAGKVVEGVDTVDILPTILDALGQEIDKKMQGESLLPLAQGLGQGYPRPSFASKYEDAHVMRLAGWKMYAGGSTTRLFEIEKDREEKNDLYESRPIERRFVMDAFSTFLLNQKEWNKREWGVASNAKAKFADDLEAAAK